MKIRYKVIDYCNRIDYTSNEWSIFETRFKFLALFIGKILGKEVEKISLNGNAEHLEETLLKQKRYT